MAIVHQGTPDVSSSFRELRRQVGRQRGRSSDIAGDTLVALRGVFLSYVLSFLNVAIYWHNHHHMYHLAKRVSGSVLWANTHLLFWLSLLPFATGWMGENNIARGPVAFYGVVLLMAGVAYFILQGRLIAANGGADSDLAKALGRDVKGKSAPLIYVVAIGTAFINPWIACALYLLVAIMWLIPDRRIERALHHGGPNHSA